jgi:hypothetical protein
VRLAFVIVFEVSIIWGHAPQGEQW